jgi:hypothetical protein
MEVRVSEIPADAHLGSVPLCVDTLRSKIICGIFRVSLKGTRRDN